MAGKKSMLRSLFRFLYFALPVAVGIVVLIYVAAQRKPPVHAAPREQARFVRVIDVRQVTAIPRIQGYGTVQPARVWNAVAQVAGKVEYVHPNFAKGSILNKGTEIIRISPEDYELSIRQSKANIRSARAKLEELTVTKINTEKSLKIETISLQLLEKDLKRKRELLRRKTISQSTYDQTRRSLLAQAQRVQDIKNRLRLMPTQIEAQKEQIAVFQVQLETAQLNLARTHIKMPFDGLVSNDKVEVTQFVTVGQVLGSADSLHAAEIDVQFPASRQQAMLHMIVSKADFRGITKDTVTQFVKKFDVRAIVKQIVGTREITWDGKIVRISDTVDPKTRTVGVVVVVEDSYAKAIPGIRPPLTKGTFVEVELYAPTHKDVNIVPRSAIQDGQIFLVNNQNRLEIMPVTETFKSGYWSYIRETIPKERMLVVSDFSPAIQGMLLKIQRDEEVETRLYTRATAGNLYNKKKEKADRKKIGKEKNHNRDGHK